MNSSAITTWIFSTILLSAFTVHKPCYRIKSLSYWKLIHTWHSRASRGSEECLVASVKISGAMLTTISSARNSAKARSKHVAQILSCLDSIKTRSRRPETFWICDKYNTMHVVRNRKRLKETYVKQVVLQSKIMLPLATCLWTQRTPSSVDSAKN